MGLLEDLGDKLAQKAIAAEERFGDPTIPDEVGKSIGATSSTLQEAYNTAVRVHRAARRAEQLLERIIEGRERGEVVKSVETGLEDDPNIH
jgi:hypothetical protein